MKICILTEGDEKKGFGHLTRCLSLYEFFKSKKIILEFIINGNETVASLLINVPHKLGVWHNDSQRLGRLLEGVDIVIIDSYLIDLKLCQEISKKVPLTVFIDDNNRLLYPSGIIVNSNIYASELGYLNRENIEYLLGLEYLSLRQEFWEIGDIRFSKNVSNILVTFGGSDIKNLTYRVLKVLVENFPYISKNVVIGQGFLNSDQIKVVGDSNTNLIFSPSAQRMKDLMCQADLAISASGQTLYELLRIPVMTIGVPVIENQLKNLQALKNSGYIESVDINLDFERDLNLKIQELIQKKSKGEYLVKPIIDGQGSSRVCEFILSSYTKILNRDGL